MFFPCIISWKFGNDITLYFIVLEITFIKCPKLVLFCSCAMNAEYYFHLFDNLSEHQFPASAVILEYLWIY